MRCCKLYWNSSPQSSNAEADLQEQSACYQPHRVVDTLRELDAAGHVECGESARQCGVGQHAMVELNSRNVLCEVPPSQSVLPQILWDESSSHQRPIIVGKACMISCHKSSREGRQPCKRCSSMGDLPEPPHLLCRLVASSCNSTLVDETKSKPKEKHVDCNRRGKVSGQPVWADSCKLSVELPIFCRFQLHLFFLQTAFDHPPSNKSLQPSESKQETDLFRNGPFQVSS
mmetsp:Transcript_10766/g.36166  ORF Transcript_10766/g.36166 Transcript_10766/m.36166 type:complete len:230 (+) Transcript_10766:1005-1694(+)